MENQEIDTGKAEPTIGQLVAEDYRKAAVFKKFGIDFCCGGKDLLDKSCDKKGIDVNEVKQALEKLEDQQAPQSSKEYQSWQLDLLIDHITSVHHKYLNEAIPLLEEFSAKVARVHGDNHPEVVTIADLMKEMARELRLHMEKEETILFPYVRQMALAKRYHQSMAAASPFGTVKNPIGMMEAEHDSAGANMLAIRELSNGFNPPEEVCITYKVLYAKLQELEDDLHQHVHLENNILFPKAIQLEREMQVKV